MKDLRCVNCTCYVQPRVSECEPVKVQINLYIQFVYSSKKSKNTAIYMSYGGNGMERTSL